MTEMDTVTQRACRVPDPDPGDTDLKSHYRMLQ